MTKHVQAIETRSAAPYETREDDPIAAAVAQVAALQMAAEQFRTDIDTRLTTELRTLTDRMGTLEARATRPAADQEQTTDPSEEQRAFVTYLRLGNQIPADEVRALTVASDPGGGYLAPAETSTEIIRDLTEISPIRALATVRQIAGPSVKYPKRTGITNAKWDGETEEAEESTVGFGQVDIPARNLTTYVDISNQLLADSGGAAEAEVRSALAEDFARKEGLAFVKGANPLQPEGIMAAAGVGYTFSGHASTLGSNPADLLISHFYSLPAPYRSRATWLMNGTTLAAIRKLKDGTTGVYLWQPAFVAGQPETILGRPVVEVPDMADVGSGTEPIAFGDIAAAYRIVDRLAMSILVDPYTQATKGITRIHATRRVGGAVVQAAALRKIRCATS